MFLLTFLALYGVLLPLRLGPGSGSFPRPLSAAEEREYVEAWVERGDVEARNLLIEHNLRLVAHIIKKGESKRRNHHKQTLGGGPKALRPDCLLFASYFRLCPPLKLFSLRGRGKCPAFPGQTGS